MLLKICPLIRDRIVKVRTKEFCMQFTVKYKTGAGSFAHIVCKNDVHHSNMRKCGHCSAFASKRTVNLKFVGSSPLTYKSFEICELGFQMYEFVPYFQWSRFVCNGPDSLQPTFLSDLL